MKMLFKVFLEGQEKLVEKALKMFKNPKFQNCFFQKPKNYLLKTLKRWLETIQKNIKKNPKKIRKKNFKAVTQDPIMTRCLRFRQNCNVTLQVYEDLYKDYTRQLKQSQITDFFTS